MRFASSGELLPEDVITMNLNDKLQLSAIVRPDNASSKGLKWSSSDETVFSVSNAGVDTSKG